MKPQQTTVPHDVSFTRSLRLRLGTLNKSALGRHHRKLGNQVRIAKMTKMQSCTTRFLHCPGLDYAAYPTKYRDLTLLAR